MAQFVDYSDFRFNGYDSRMFGVSIVTTDSNNTERIFGLNSSMETEDGIGDSKLFLRRKSDTYEFSVEIMKIGAWNEVIPMSSSEHDDIIRWLMVDDICPLEVGGLVYYGFFKSGTEFHNPYKQGIMKLEFESIIPYAYSPIVTSNIKVLSSKIFELENKSNLNRKVYLDIYIEKINKKGNVDIQNLRDGKLFRIKELEIGEKIKIIGDGVLEIESITNPSKSMFKYSEYKSFPYLDYGTSKFKITGDCNIVIQYQVPIALR